MNHDIKHQTDLNEVAVLKISPAFLKLSIFQRKTEALSQSRKDEEEMRTMPMRHPQFNFAIRKGMTIIKCEKINFSPDLKFFQNKMFGLLKRKKVVLTLGKPTSKQRNKMISDR